MNIIMVIMITIIIITTEVDSNGVRIETNIGNRMDITVIISHILKEMITLMLVLHGDQA